MSTCPDKNSTISLWLLTHILGDKYPPAENTLQLGLPFCWVQLSAPLPCLPRAHRTFSRLPQDRSHHDATEGLVILGAERSQGSHEVSGGRLGEGLDLWTEKAGGGDSSEGKGVQETSAPTLTRPRKSCSARTAALV